jgi:hypothetical protein
VLPPLFLLGVFGLLVFGGIAWISASIDSKRRIPLDLAARFRREVLREAQGRYGAYLALPVIVAVPIFISIWAMNRPKAESMVEGLASMQWFVLAFSVVVIAVEFVSGVIAVLQAGGVPSDADLIFGWQEMKRDARVNLVMLPVMLMVFGLWYVMPSCMNPGNHRAVVASVESLRQDPGLRFLEGSQLDHDQEAFTAVNVVIRNFDDDRKDSEEYAAAHRWWAVRVMVLTVILVLLIFPIRLAEGRFLTRWFEARSVGKEETF